jgi:sugar phosphate isomerase/epimerase
VAAAAPKKSVKGVALQLYTLREQAKQDLPGTLKKVREIGYAYVQWSGMPNMPAEGIRAALDAADLKAVSAHVGVDGFENDFANQVKFWKTVGVEALGPGGMMDGCWDTLEGWKAGSKRLDEVGAKLRAEGIKLSYHNHDREFEKFDGDPRCKLDILFETAKPENLIAELDLAWVHAGGADPAAYIRKYKGRCPIIHAKDMTSERGKKGRFAALGQGSLNWTDIFAAGREAGVEWYIYEQDNCYGKPFECAQISYDFLAKNVGQA